MKKIMIPVLISLMIIACNLFGGAVQAPAAESQGGGAGESAAMQTQIVLAQTQQAQAAQNIAQQQTEVAIQAMTAQSAMDVNAQMTEEAATQTQESLGAQLTATVGYILTQAVITQTSIAMSSDPHYRGVASGGTDFKGATVYAWGQLDKNTYTFTIQLMSAVGPETFHMEVAGKSFKCEVLASYPDRLYCRGPLSRDGKHILEIYEYRDGNSYIVFREEYAIKWTPTPIPIIKKTPTPES